MGTQCTAKHTAQTFNASTTQGWVRGQHGRGQGQRSSRSNLKNLFLKPG